MATLKRFPNKPLYLRAFNTRVLKTQWEKEKLPVTSNFSFSRSAFYPPFFWGTFCHFHESEIWLKVGKLTSKVLETLWELKN